MEEELYEGDDLFEDEEEEEAEVQPPRYRALAPLSQGSKIVWPGEVVELDEETATILITKGKVVPVGAGDD